MPANNRLSAFLARNIFSLERRLIGALLLIAFAVGGMLAYAQYGAIAVRDRSEALERATKQAQSAQRLVELVAEFRVASNLQLSAPTSAGSTTGGGLTDAAIAIGEAVNGLRISGMALDGVDQEMATFADLDRHVAAISDARGAVTPDAEVLTRNRAMADVASGIADMAAREHDLAQDVLDATVGRWRLVAGASAALILILVIVMAADLVGNILPALRRMHRMLRRLAEGDLDFTVENFRLRELQALSGPLETFRRNAQAVKNLAFTDPSTGLPNRRAFMELTQRRLTEAAGQGLPFAVMAADIDRFKHVNDDFGHAAGDRLVQMIAERMKEELGLDAIIARIGGDEFAICVPLGDCKDARVLGARLIGAMRRAFDLGNFSVAVTLSVGTMDVNAGEDLDVAGLLHRADLALYAAKDNGRNCAQAFTAALEEERALEEMLERDLSRALGDGELRMVYQPIHPVGEICEAEVEALVRWKHPVLGEIPPPRFIAAAERSGLMVQLGSWIMERAISDLARWPGMALSLNLSPLQLQQDGFVALLLESCRRNGIQPQRLILEVTETLSIERNDRALLTLELLRNAGCRIALDDFGTGYSSLCMMKTFKFDRLKLDRSLINDLGSDATAKAVFDAAVTMALRVGAQVVAEGISDEGLIEPVAQAGCTHMQGFHFSRPIEAESVADYFAGNPRAEQRAA